MDIARYDALTAGSTMVAHHRALLKRAASAFAAKGLLLALAGAAARIVESSLHPNPEITRQAQRAAADDMREAVTATERVLCDLGMLDAARDAP